VKYSFLKEISIHDLTFSTLTAIYSNARLARNVEGNAKNHGKHINPTLSISLNGDRLM